MVIDTLRWSSYPILDCLTALLLTAIALKLLDLVIDRIVRRLARWTRIGLDDEAVNVLHRPLIALAGLLGAGLSLRLLVVPVEIEVGDSEQKAALAQEAADAVAHPAGNLLQQLARTSLAPERLQTFDRVLWTLAIAILAFATARIIWLAIDVMGRRPGPRGELARELRPIMVNLAKAAVFLGAAMAALGVWDISITPLLASAGVVGLAVALAAQDSLANFFGGVSIFLDRSYVIGDYIVLDGQERGEVEEIGLRSTRLRTRDDVLITIPNSIMAASKVVNQSGPGGRFRVRLPVGIAYGSDIDQAEALMLAITSEEPLALVDPAPRVRFRAFGSSSIELELLCWCADPSERGLLVHRLGKAIYRSFREAEVEIPFPQLELHLPKGIDPAEPDA